MRVAFAAILFIVVGWWWVKRGFEREREGC